MKNVIKLLIDEKRKYEVQRIIEIEKGDEGMATLWGETINEYNLAISFLIILKELEKK